MKIEWKSCFKIGFSLFLLYLCIHYWGSVAGMIGGMLMAGMPLIIGGIVAYIVNILMSFYEKHYFPKSKNKLVHKTRRPICMFLSFLTVVLIVFVVIALVVPRLITCVSILLSEVPAFLEDVVAFIEDKELLPQNITALLTQVNWSERLGQIIQVITSGVGNVANVVINALSSIFSFVVTALLAVMFSIYLLANKETLGSQFNRICDHYMSEKHCKRLKYILSVFNKSFHNYVVGQCLEAIVIGVLCTLGMLCLRLKYAGMIGALVAFTALIPVAGAYIGALTGAFMILTVSPIQAVIFLIYIVILQQVETNLIYPRVVGSSMGLPGIWVLAAVTVGGGVMGILGMLISVPIAASLYQFIKDDMKKKRR